MNQITIHGRLTRDPEMKTGGSGVEFCKFTVAVDRRGAKEKTADFFDCTAFGKTGAASAQYMTKGREILVTGRMESSKSEKDGQTRTFWALVVESFEFCGSKGDGHAPAGDPVPVDTPEGLPF